MNSPEFLVGVAGVHSNSLFRTRCFGFISPPHAAWLCFVPRRCFRSADFGNCPCLTAHVPQEQVTAPHLGGVRLGLLGLATWVQRWDLRARYVISQVPPVRIHHIYIYILIHYMHAWIAVWLAGWRDVQNQHSLERLQVFAAGLWTRRSALQPPPRAVHPPPQGTALQRDKWGPLGGNPG